MTEASKSVDQWAYGAVLDYWQRWNAVRIAIYRKRPRRRVGGALSFALGAAATIAAPRRAR